MAKVDFALRPGELNAHYEGAYSERGMEWRRIGAVEKARNLRALLGSRAAHVQSVLEVGCGTGAVLAAIRDAGVGVQHEGVDMADPSQHADAAATRAGLRLVTYDGARLPYPDKSYDLVFASHVLEHVPDERGFLAELQRVAKKFVYVEVPCELHIRSSATELQKTLNIGHINAYTPEAFALKLFTAGLAVQDLQVFDHIDELYHFQSSPMKARLRMALRRGLLRANPHLASKVFCYHSGAIATV